MISLLTLSLLKPSQIGIQRESWEFAHLGAVCWLSGGEIRDAHALNESFALVLWTFDYLVLGIVYHCSYKVLTLILPAFPSVPW